MTKSCLSGEGLGTPENKDGNTYIYHTSNSHECMGVNGEALQLHVVYRKPFFHCKSRENPYQVYCKSHEKPDEYYKSCEVLYQVLQVILLRLNMQ